MILDSPDESMFHQAQRDGVEAGDEKFLTPYECTPQELAGLDTVRTYLRRETCVARHSCHRPDEIEAGLLARLGP